MAQRKRDNREQHIVDQAGRVWVEGYRREPNKVPGHYRGAPNRKRKR